jgi:cellulose biosynthesis protein BcsQ
MPVLSLADPSRGPLRPRRSQQPHLGKGRVSTVTSVAVSHVKGGGGKTTFTYGLALELAARGRSVELIDRDQNNTSLSKLAEASGLPDRVWLRNGVAHGADVHLSDCPPAIDDVNVRAISEADVLVVPAIPERLVMDVLVDMLAMVDQVKRLNPTLRVALVPNLVRQQWPAHAAFIDSMAALAEEHGLMLLDPVPSRQAIMLGDWRGRPLRHVADWIVRAC